MLLNKMHKVLQTQAAGEQCRKQDSESLIHVSTISDRRAPWSREHRRTIETLNRTVGEEDE